MMSTSDSDYSVDWLASDEEDYDSPGRLSPPCTDTQPPPSSTTKSSRDSPRKVTHSGPIQSDDDCTNTGGHCRRLNRERRGSTDFPCPTVAPSPAPDQRCPCGSQMCPRVSGPASEATVTGTHLQVRKRPHSPGSTGHCESPKPEDGEKEMFLHKCRELQCYIQPLSSILHGLRSGRYSERLSSFQESVALDRIQRIMGVLQNPNMGERFLSIILKIEKMLQSWFPNTRPSTAATHTDGSTPAKNEKQHASAPPPPLSSDAEQALRARDARTATHLKWLHTSPICSLEAPGPAADRPSAPPRAMRWDLGATQDNAVSSSTDSPTSLRHSHAGHRRRQPFKISSPCLERLLQAKESIIAPRTVGDGGTSERSCLS